MSADDSTCYPYCLQDFGSPRQQLQPNLHRLVIFRKGQLVYRLGNRVAAASHWTHFRRMGLGRYEFRSGFSSAGRDFARLKGAHPANIPIWQERV
jgi:hypothetical protein